MKVSLTFDNGPHPEVTPQVLDTLERRGVAATFFVVGNKVIEPGGLDLVRRTHAAGHRIGNHTFTHSVPLGEMADAAASVSEISRTAALIGEFVGPDKLFRPFGRQGRLGPHLLSSAALDHLVQERSSCVVWSSVPRDWEYIEDWPQRAFTDIRRDEWSVVVLHDIATGAMARLDDFLAEAIDTGVEFTTEFPEACAPLWRGRFRWDMSGYVT